jgi:NH3-dependent NAD+ synthetase
MRFDIVSNIFKKPPSTELSTELDDEKKVHTSSDAISNITNEKVDSIPENKSESSEEDIGVQGVSASNQVWSKKSLIATYIW